MALFQELNENQLKAATTFYGPIMVFAGAGSGKTKTLTCRIANMIEAGIPAYQILAITFTNKATKEMKDRLINVVGMPSFAVTISTFHSLCARILRKEIHLLGYKNNFSILDEEEQLSVISEIISENNIDKKTYSARSSRKMINYNKCFNLKPSFPIEKIIFEKYQQKMKELNCLDFEDLLIKTYELFQISKETLEKYRYKFQFILVDEFQDTNLIQFKIIKMLAEIHRNIFIVGDDDQSIYSFRGTNYENMNIFKKDFPELQLIILNQNYRSTQSIINGSNNLIAHNVNRQKKELFSNITGNIDDVVIMQLRDERDEVNYVLEEIQARIRNHQKAYKDFAILYRSSVVSRNFELGLIQHNIPYKIYGGFSYLKRKEIKDMIAYLKLIVDHEDILSFVRIVNVPARGLGKTTIQNLVQYANTNRINIFDAIDKCNLPLSKYQELKVFKEMICELTNKLEEITLFELFEVLLEKTNYLDEFKDEEDEEEKIENLMEFKSILALIENSGEVASRKEKLLEAFDEAVLADDKLQNQKQNEEGITLSTVHSVKGLEFDTVFVVGFENGIFPNIYRNDDMMDEEEERRIAYVATTRAKQKLYLTCAQRRLLYGDVKAYGQSKFLIEFIGHKAPTKYKIKKEHEQQNSNSGPYKIGEYIIHKVYGEGIIVSLDGTMGKICFASKGQIKTFDMLHPAISKK